ncbi:MAG: hypothetical protein K2O10_01345, partial [Muribaculaceae bacterium]|nr:hypothetical protein [Muribaculaceae bacterium]
TLELLGSDDFGIYGVIGGVVALFSFLSRTLTVSFNRFICIGIAHDDTREINHVVGASIVIQLLIIGLVLVLGETIGLWFINNYLVIKPEKLVAAHVVFQFSVATFILNIFTSAYNSIIISFEKMSVYAYICIFEVIAKLAVVFALALSASNRLEYYSGYIFGVQAIILAVYYFYARKAYPQIRAVFAGCRRYVRSMVSFAGYGFIGSFAFVVKNQSLNFLLNIFGGPALNAARAISFQVYTAVYNFVGNFQTAFSPYILKRQACDSVNTCNNDVSVFTHMSFAIMCLIMIPIWFAAPQIIHLWLGDNVPEFTVIFTRLILIIGLCEALSAPLQNIISGSGNIRGLQISAFAVYMLVVGVSYLLLRWGYSPSSVYYVDVAANLLMLGLRVLIAWRITDLRLGTYLCRTALPVALVSGLIGMLYYLTARFEASMVVSSVVAEVFLAVYLYMITPSAVRREIKKKLRIC